MWVLSRLCIEQHDSTLLYILNGILKAAEKELSTLPVLPKDIVPLFYITRSYSAYFNSFSFDSVVVTVLTLLNLLLSLCSRQRRQQKRRSEQKVLLSGFCPLCLEVDDSGLYDARTVNTVSTVL